MLFKLSLRNAKRQVNDYLVYLITIILAAALIYAFNGLIDSREIQKLSESMQSLPVIIVLASIVVVGIMGWLVHYTMRFMLTKRSRELGTYILMGIENKQVVQLYFWENVIIGGVALVIGIVTGNLLFQGLRAVILQMFGIPYHFQFALSFKAFGLTLLYFLLIYTFALKKSQRRIRKMKIRALLYLEKENETAAIKKKKLRERGFVLSIIQIVVGTGMLLLRNLYLGIIGAVLIIVGLYIFFINFSSGVPSFFEKHPLKKFQGTNLLVYRSLSSKLTTMGITMATIAVLFTATLISEGAGLLFINQGERHAELITSFDLFIGSSDTDTDFASYKEYIAEHIPVYTAHEYQLYLNNTNHVTQYLLQHSERYWSEYEKDTLIPFSDYKALRKILGYPEVELQQEGYIIHCMDHLKAVLDTFGESIQVSGKSLSKAGIYTENLTQYLWDGNGSGYILVVPDEVITTQEAAGKSYAVMTESPISLAAVKGLTAIRDKRAESGMTYDSIFSPISIREDNAIVRALAVFPLFYLALVLTMAATTILTTHLLSDTDKYRQQYSLLGKMGMDKKDMKKALRRQFALFYAMPALPPLLISITFMSSLGQSFDPGIIVNALHLCLIIGTALLLFFFIYGIYIVIAYISFKRSVFLDVFSD